MSAKSPRSRIVSHRGVTTVPRAAASLALSSADSSRALPSAMATPNLNQPAPASSRETYVHSYCRLDRTQPGPYLERMDIQFTPEQVERLAQIGARDGKPLEKVVQDIIDHLVDHLLADTATFRTAVQRGSAAATVSADAAERARAFVTWARNHPRTPPLSDDAIRREHLTRDAR